MELIPLKSRRFQKNSELLALFREALEKSPLQGESLREGDILIIASKVVAYSQGLLVKVKDREDFRALIRREADRVLEDGEMVLTLKNRVLIPNAGIDQSNTPDGEAVLWPEKPFEAAQKIRADLMRQYGLEKFGVLISDSHCQPLRLGTSGIAIGWAGFEGVADERGAKDLFGRKMVYTRIATADNLASAANLEMGETDASVPFVLVRGFKGNFTEKSASEEDYFIPPEECLYKKLYGEKLMSDH